MQSDQETTNQEHSALNQGEPPFVGRDAELSEVKSHYHRAENGTATLLLLEARSGEGKSRLLKEFRKYLSTQKNQPLVVQGQGINSNQQPFHLFSQIVRKLLSDEDGKTLLISLAEKTLTPIDVHAMCHALPELKAVFQDASTDEPVDGSQGEQRTINAFVKLLSGLGHAERPFVLLIDDAQWVDALTLRVLAQFKRSLQAGSVDPLLLLIAYRAEESQCLHTRGIIDESIPRIELYPFTDEQMNQLIRAMATEIPNHTLADIVAHADKNIYLATTAVREFLESQTLATPTNLSDDAGNFIQRRLNHLSENELNILEHAALIGKRFSIVLLTEAVGKQSSEVLEHLQTAHKRCFVSKLESDYEFFHDKVRESVLQRLSEEHKRAVHGRIAEAMQIVAPRDIFSIAFHYDAAKNFILAQGYALKAAKDARHRFALEAAEIQYRIAEKKIELATPEIQYDIYEGLGVTSMNRGKYKDAEKYLIKAAVLTEDSVSAAYLNLKIGELRVRQGDFRRAAKALEEGLRQIGDYDQAKAVRSLALTPFYMLVHCLLWVCPSFIKQKIQKNELSVAESISMQLLNRLAYAYWFGIGSYRSAAPHYRSLYMGELRKPSIELLHAYTGHAMLFSVFGFYRNSVRYCIMARGLQEAVGNQWSNGQYQNFFGIIEFGASRFRNSLELCSEAVRHLEIMGDFWEANVAHAHVCCSLMRLGNFTKARELATEYFQRFKELGDNVSQALSLFVLGITSFGEADEKEAQRIAENSSGNDYQAHLEALLTIVYNHMYSGKYSEAFRILQEAEGFFNGRIFTLSYIQAVRPLLVHVCRISIAELSEQKEDPKTLARLHKQWRMWVYKSIALSFFYTNHLPHSLREAAIYWASKGSARRARWCVQKSLRVATKQGARHEIAFTLMVAQYLDKKYGITTDADPLPAAKALLKSCEIPEDKAEVFLNLKFESL